MRICYLDVHESQYKRLTINTPTEAVTKINLESKLQDSKECSVCTVCVYFLV